MSSGAVITGRRTGDFADYWGGDHHDCVPIFVPTHKPPAQNPYERVHYITDGIESCVQQAKAAAGDRDVMLHGAYTGQESLKAGVLDAIEIQLRPVLLGQGRRLFDNLPPKHIELDLVRTAASETGPPRWQNSTASSVDRFDHSMNTPSVVSTHVNISTIVVRDVSDPREQSAYQADAFAYGRDGYSTQLEAMLAEGWTIEDPTALDNLGLRLGEDGKLESVSS